IGKWIHRSHCAAHATTRVSRQNGALSHTRRMSVLSPRDFLAGLEFFGIRLGLDNIQRLVEALGHPQERYATVHVAGTNGKGSVAALVDAVLRAAGYRTGRYTSPHLQCVNE